MAIYLSNVRKIENMRDLGFDPHDNRSGPKPKDGGHKPMHVSFSAGNRKALEKIKEKQGISPFLNKLLKPIAEQLDPGPASPILLEFWNGLTDKVASLVKEDDLDAAIALGHVLVDIKPAIQPYLDLCEEDENGNTEKKNLDVDVISTNHNYTLDSMTSDNVADIINDVTVVKLLEQLYDVLQNLQSMLQRIPDQYKTKWHSDGMDELCIKTGVTEKILKKYGADVLQQKQSTDNSLDIMNSEYTDNFRKGLLIFDTQKQCEEITQKAKGVQNYDIRSFVSESCEFVLDTINKFASFGIDINVESYLWDESSHSYFVKLFNCGNYDVDISEVWCDGQKCLMHAWYAKSSNFHLPVNQANKIQFRPCRPTNDTTEHKIIIKTPYKEFSFVIKGKKSEHLY